MNIVRNTQNIDDNPDLKHVANQLLYNYCNENLATNCLNYANIDDNPDLKDNANQLLKEHCIELTNYCEEHKHDNKHNNKDDCLYERTRP